MGYVFSPQTFFLLSLLHYLLIKMTVLGYLMKFSTENTPIRSFYRLMKTIASIVGLPGLHLAANGREKVTTKFVVTVSGLL